MIKKVQWQCLWWDRHLLVRVRDQVFSSSIMSLTTKQNETQVVTEYIWQMNEHKSVVDHFTHLINYGCQCWEAGKASGGRRGTKVLQTLCGDGREHWCGSNVPSCHPIKLFAESNKTCLKEESDASKSSRTPNRKCIIRRSQTVASFERDGNSKLWSVIFLPF